jgi:hypothetical protein
MVTPAHIGESSGNGAAARAAGHSMLATPAGLLGASVAGISALRASNDFAKVFVPLLGSERTGWGSLFHITLGRRAALESDPADPCAGG